jgi:hypothetical protein
MRTMTNSPIAVRNGSTTGRIVAGLALVFSWAITAHADSPRYEPGRYLLIDSADGNSGGTLDIKAGRSASCAVQPEGSEPP